MSEKLYALGFLLMVVCACMMDSSRLLFPTIIGIAGVACVAIARGCDDGESEL